MNKTLGIKWRKQSQMAGDRPPMMSPGVSLRGVSIGYSYVCMYVYMYVRMYVLRTYVCMFVCTSLYDYLSVWLYCTKKLCLQTLAVIATKHPTIDYEPARRSNLQI